MKRQFRSHPWLFVTIATWGGWFFSLWPKWFWIDESGIWAGQPFIWADWSVHLTYVARFLSVPMQQWFEHHPVFAMEPWTYPPLPNLFSALLVAFGLPLGPAMVLPVVLATAALLVALFVWFRVHHLSERAGFLGLSLFLLSGSWGWPAWLKTIFQSADPLFEVQFPSRLYTQIFESHLVWLNPVAGMVLPQRSFTLGFPLLIFILIRLRDIVMRKSPILEKKIAILLSCLSAVLLLTHTHSFLALALLSLVWFLLFPRLWKFWLTYGVGTAILIFPWYWFVLRGSSAVTSFSIDLGWMSPEPFGVLSWIWFWLKNWGLLLPLALVGWWQANWKERNWLSGFFFLFFFANVVRTQAYDWDNAKLLVVVLIGLLPAMIAVLRRLRLKFSPLLSSAIVIFIIFLSIWGGTLEVIRISQPNRTTWRMAGQEEREFALKAQQLIPPNEIVLTSDLHNHPVPMLAGRAVLMGYVGWVWSYGFDYQQIERDVHRIYTDSSMSLELRKKYNLKYIVVGPHERTKFGDAVFLKTQCQSIAINGSFEIFRCDL